MAFASNQLSRARGSATIQLCFNLQRVKLARFVHWSEATAQTVTVALTG